jgi:phosphatidylserine synthase
VDPSWWVADPGLGEWLVRKSREGFRGWPILAGSFLALVLVLWLVTDYTDSVALGILVTLVVGSGLFLVTLGFQVFRPSARRSKTVKR